MTPQAQKIDYHGERPSPFALRFAEKDRQARAATLQLNSQKNPLARLWKFVRQSFGI
jgi:hypothetical protein